MEKKIAVLLIIIFLLIGFGIGKIYEKGAWQSRLVQIQEEIDWLKSQLEMGYQPPAEEIYGLSGEVYALSGAVVEVGDEFLVMEIVKKASPSSSPTETRRKKINVTEETGIFRFGNEVLSFEEIKPGDSVIVFSEESTQGKTEITASAIEIY